MKYIKNINEAVSGEISTNDLYVVKSYRDIDINVVYSSKSDAQSNCDKQNDEWYKYQRNLHKKMKDKEFEEYFKTFSNTKRIVTLYYNSRINTL